MAIARAASRSPRRLRLPTALVLVASVLTFMSVLAIWVERQALDTDAWVGTSSKLLADPAIRGSLSEYLVEQVDDDLPDFTEGAAEDAVEAALESAPAQALWEATNRTAHEQMVKLIEDRDDIVATGGGDVSLELGALVQKLGEEVGVSDDVLEDFPTDSARVDLVHADQLDTAQSVVKILRGAALILPLAALALFGLAVFIVRGRRPTVVFRAGIALVCVGLAALGLRSVGGWIVVDQLVSKESVEPAAEAAWSIGTSLLSDLARTLLAAGVAVAVCGWLCSASRVAHRIRHALAPALLRSPGLVYGVIVLILAVFLLSGPANLRTILTALVLASFGAIGVRALRAQVIDEAGEPDGT